MSRLNYSDEALGVRQKFFRVTVMVYIEGDDDKLFWERVLSGHSVRVEGVGGCLELEKRIQKIVSGDLDAIAAGDMDYRGFKSSIQVHPRIMYSKGHSIENSIYTPEIIYFVARAWARGKDSDGNLAEEWLSLMASNLNELVRLDVFCELNSLGISALGDNCARFMKGANSHLPCPEKIQQRIVEIRESLVERGYSGHSEAPAIPDTILWLRGHFLATAVARFVKHSAAKSDKKANVSSDALYVAAVSAFHSLYESGHPHFSHYSSQVVAAMSSFG